MKEMKLVPATTPKGKGITKNQILAQKQLWVDEMGLVPVVQIASDRDIDQMPPKLPPHSSPNSKRPNKSNRQVEISQDPTCNDYWAPVTNQEYRETKEAFDQTYADALHCRQL